MSADWIWISGDVHTICGGRLLCGQEPCKTRILGQPNLDLSNSLGKVFLLLCQDRRILYRTRSRDKLRSRDSSALLVGCDDMDTFSADDIAEVALALASFFIVGRANHFCHVTHRARPGTVFLLAGRQFHIHRSYHLDYGFSRARAPFPDSRGKWEERRPIGHLGWGVGSLRRRLFGDKCTLSVCGSRDGGHLLQVGARSTGTANPAYSILRTCGFTSWIHRSRGGTWQCGSRSRSSNLYSRLAQDRTLAEDICRLDRIHGRLPAYASAGSTRTVCAFVARNQVSIADRNPGRMAINHLRNCRRVDFRIFPHLHCDPF